MVSYFKSGNRIESLRQCCTYVDSSTIHVDGGTHGNNELGNSIWDSAGIFDASEGDRNGGGTASASKGSGLSRCQVADVLNWVGLGQDSKETNVDKKDVGGHGNQGSNNQITNVGEGFLEVALLSDGICNEGEDSKGCDHDDPVNQSQEDFVNFFQEADKNRLFLG